MASTQIIGGPMGKKQKTKETTVAEEKGGSHYVRMEATVIVAFIALVVGFFAGEMINLSRPKTPASIQTSARPAQTSLNQGPAIEQASRISALEAAVSSNPGDVEGWSELGNLYFDSNQFQQAIRAYEQALKLNPNDADVWTDLGVMYRRSGQPLKAIESFNKAKDIDSRHEASRLNKGIVLIYDLDDREGAIKAWEELLRLNPSAKLGNGQPVKELLDKLKGTLKNRKTLDRN
jgi:cytochrome c-type biogenesis protein CcmH/NrfG